MLCESQIDDNQTETTEEFFMKYIQSKDNLKKGRQFINDLFVSSGGERMKFVERRIYQINKNLRYNREIHFIAEQSFSLKYENLVDSMNKKLEESSWKDHELMRYFKPECGIQVGQRLESLPNLEKLVGDKAVRNYTIEEGRISIIYIWTIYKSICKKQLKLLNDLFQENFNWEGSVKLISINTDINRDYAKKTINTLQLNKMEHLYIDSNKHPNHPVFNVTNKYGYPVFILVNNDNFIDVCGSLFEVDLKKKINEMINRELVSTTSLYPNTGLNEAEKKVLKNIVKNIETQTKILKESLQAPHLVGGSLRVKKIFTANSTNNFNYTKPSLTSSNQQQVEKTVPLVFKKSSVFSKQADKLHNLRKPQVTSPKLKAKEEIQKEGYKPTSQISCELEYYCHPLDEQVVDSLFINSDQIRKMNVIKNFVETFEITYSEPDYICDNCHKEVLTYNFNHCSLNLNDSGITEDCLSINNQFYCAICRAYFCKSCGDSKTDLSMPDKLHNHFLYYLTPRNKYFMKFILMYNYDNTYEFDFKYFQENRKTNKFIHDIKHHYQVKCDGCLGFPIKSARWKCCNCIFKNICDNCKSTVENHENKFADNYESIMYNMEVVGCNPLEHVFMKIVFDSFVY